MRLTALGRAVVLLATTAVLLGGALGLGTVLAFGAGLVVLVGVAAALVAEVPAVGLTRLATPPEVARGHPAEVLLRFTSTAPGRARPVTVIETIDGVEHGATVGPIPTDGVVTLAYPVPTHRRGMVIAGPLVVRYHDPFGLVVADRRFGGTSIVRVRPRRLPIRLLPAGRRRELEGPTRERSEGTTAFHQLRPYAPGDDLRRIHWRSTARHGDLLVKQMVDTTQPELVIVLDNRAEVIAEDEFEEAVDIAASLVAAAEAEGHPAELTFTVEAGADHGQRVADLDRLTAVRVQAGSSLAVLADRLRVRGHGLVVVTGELGASDLATVASLARRADPAMVVSVRSEPTHPFVAPHGMRGLACRDALEFVTQWGGRW